MLPADKKKKENIAEYILYMYQAEDLIRAYHFDLNEITKYVVVNMPLSPSIKKKIILWYAELILQMQDEHLNKGGHLKQIQAEVKHLEHTHNELLKTDYVYKTIYGQAEESINEHILFSENSISSPIQICLNSLYGMLLLKLNGKKIQSSQQKTVEQQSEILSYLSKVYKKNLD